MIPSKGPPLKKMRDGSMMALHRIRAEHALGRPLPKGVEVHHVDRDPWNATARLVICENHAYHMFLHRRMRERAKRMAV